MRWTRHRGLRLCRPSSRLTVEESGSALLEFSLSVWMLLLMAFLIFEFCMMTYTYSVLGDAAREGVRYAIVHGTDNSSCSGPSTGCGDTGGSNVTAVVNSYAAVSFHNTSSMTVTPSWPDGVSTPASRVVVTITYPYIPYLSLGIFSAPTMTIIAEGRIVY
jgi:Flp pilus assembly protein TadG